MIKENKSSARPRLDEMQKSFFYRVMNLKDLKRTKTCLSDFFELKEKKDGWMNIQYFGPDSKRKPRR
jgi:hypothetical protein